MESQKSPPEYDPFYQDIRFDDRLETADNAEDRQAIEQQGIDFTKRKKHQHDWCPKDRKSHKATILQH